jgi:hypothetical protein
MMTNERILLFGGLFSIIFLFTTCDKKITPSPPPPPVDTTIAPQVDPTLAPTIGFLLMIGVQRTLPFLLLSQQPLCQLVSRLLLQLTEVM